MEIKKYPISRAYGDAFEEVRLFIQKMNEKGKSDNYHWSRWEWYFARGSFENEALDHIRLFYINNDLIGVLMLEDEPDIYHYVTDHSEVKKLIVAEIKKQPTFKLMVEDQDLEMIKLMVESEYEKTDYIEHMAYLTKDHIDYHLPDDYQIVNLDDHYDVKKHHACLWYGFGHQDTINYDKETLVDRKRQIESPHFKKKYANAIEYDNQYVAYTSIWYEQGTDIAMIEPVCTVPEHRRKGLAKATISECVKSVIRDGAKRIIVGSNQEFYKRLGFEVFRYATVYQKKNNNSMK